MVKRRTGLDPLAYMGVEPSTPSQFVQEMRNPTTTDYDNFNLMAVWLNRNTFQIWMLVSKANFVATWREFTNDIGNLNTLTGDLGGAVPPTANNIDIEGSGAYLFTGDPGTSTLTLSDDGSVATSYEADTGTATPTGNILNVIGASGIETTGFGNTLTIGIGSNEFVKTLTGDTGGAVGPDISDNINIVGAGGITVAGNPGTNTLTISGTGMGNQVKITKFTASGTFDKDPNAVYIRVVIWNGGGGGGSGAYDRAISPAGASTGGYGGSGGAILISTFFADQFAASTPIVVGAGGTGGASQTSPSTNGNTGGDGGLSEVGEIFPGDITGSGNAPTYNAYGNGGLGGGHQPPTAGFPGSLLTADNAIYGGTRETTPCQNRGGTPSPGNNSDPSAQSPDMTQPLLQYVCTGGGAGGSYNFPEGELSGGYSGYILAFGSVLPTGIVNPLLFAPSLIVQPGATGGVESGVINGGNGSNMISTGYGRIIGSTGGGGGGAQYIGSVCGSGGNGGVPSGGAGGGGASNSVASGPGGDGARGEVWIYETLGSLIT